MQWSKRTEPYDFDCQARAGREAKIAKMPKKNMLDDIRWRVKQCIETSNNIINTNTNVYCVLDVRAQVFDCIFA